MPATEQIDNCSENGRADIRPFSFNASQGWRRVPRQVSVELIGNCRPRAKVAPLDFNAR